MKKNLFRKIESLARNPTSASEFILCDAKDNHPARANCPPGDACSREAASSSFPYRSENEFLDRARELVEQQAIDLMLLSDNAYRRLKEDRAFDASGVVPARRAAGHTPESVELKAAASFACPSGEAETGTPPVYYAGPDAPEKRLVLVYNLLLKNDAQHDLAALDAYDRFRREAASQRLPHILELYSMASPAGESPSRVRHILPDRLMRLLLEGSASLRPLLLKTPYYSPRLLESVAAALPQTPVGVLGGDLPTSYDAFALLKDSRSHGARSALLGRRIARAEHQPAFARMLRLVADGEVEPAEAVHAYHGVLQGLGIRPFRALDEDVQPGARLLAGEAESCVSIIVPADVEPGEVSGGRMKDSPHEKASAQNSPAENPAEKASWSVWTGAAGESDRISLDSSRRSGLGQQKSDHPASYVPLSQRSDDEEPDFDRMTLEEKLAYNQRRRDRIFG